MGNISDLLGNRITEYHLVDHQGSLSVLQSYAEDHKMKSNASRVPSRRLPPWQSIPRVTCLGPTRQAPQLFFLRSPPRRGYLNICYAKHRRQTRNTNSFFSISCTSLYWSIYYDCPYTDITICCRVSSSLERFPFRFFNLRFYSLATNYKLLASTLTTDQYVFENGRIQGTNSPPCSTSIFNSSTPGSYT